jgi:hypothetical protein
MINSFVADILARGEAAINEIVTEKREETLHLEFKTLSSNGSLNRDDRKMIAKAICGFANAEGGLLIIGVETTKIDGVDAAFDFRPVHNLSRFRSLVTAAIPELLSPQHNSIFGAFHNGSVSIRRGVHLNQNTPLGKQTAHEHFRATLF